MKMLYFLFIFCRSPLNRYYKQVFFLRGLHQLNLLKLLRVLRQKPDTHFVYKLDHRGFQTTYLIQRLTSRIQRQTSGARLASEQDQRAVQDWYASHPREASEEAEHWTRMTAESAERLKERHEWREERQAAKARAEEELARGAANWPVGDPRWIALEDDISSSVTEDDFTDDEEE